MQCTVLILVCGMALSSGLPCVEVRLTLTVSSESYRSSLLKMLVGVVAGKCRLEVGPHSL